MTCEDDIQQWKESPGPLEGYENSTYKYYWAQLFISYDYETFGPLEDEYIPERYKTVPKDTGDINGDGEINSYDLITINKYLAKKIDLNDLQIASADILKGWLCNIC